MARLRAPRRVPAPLTPELRVGCQHCRRCDTCQDCGRCAGQGCACVCEAED